MDETQPLLADVRILDTERCDEVSHKDIVDFNVDGDAENPMEWPTTYKWGIVLLLSFMAFTVTFTCISVVPIANQIVYDLEDGHVSKSASVLLVTIWELGEAAGPLLIAPLSEVFGRSPVMNGANVLFILATALAAMSQSTPIFIGARALTGLSVASNVLGPAIVGDMFISEQRGSAISCIALAPLIGGSLGPAIGGAIAEKLGWRWVLWLSVCLALVCELVFFTCFRETYKVAVLRRRAATLRKETGNPKLRTVFDMEEDRKSSLHKIWECAVRPAIVLSGSSVLQVLSLHGAVSFSYYYVFSTTFPAILQDLYGLTPAAAGLAFLCFSIGSIISLLFLNFLLDKIYVKLRDQHKGVGAPEFRLPIGILGAFGLPLSVVAYGWASQLRLPLPLLLFAVGLVGTTLMLVILPLNAYVVDAFGLYAASGMTAIIVTRCLMSTVLPLATDPLVQRFGWGLGVSVLGGIGIVLVPIPILVFKFGSRWRQLSKYTKDE
ncbi:MFS transporter [Xylaria bambusicola]|uniref:MFS transporter n=1 Tax=Xylaria bambusicola TaxID=326684 RepID=UPI002007B76C|nr:MFS transporter [Xylaria bambusicola]KAI0506556.1 MFS transporter [Xylaria bambusicola]